MNFEPLITQNIKNSEFFRTINGDVILDKIYPTITLSRDPGSGGRDVAKLVAKKLGISLCDKKQLAKLVAVKTGVKTEDLKKIMDEQIQPPMESIIGNFLGLKKIPDQVFIKSLVAVAIEIAGQKPAVILGSGMNFVMPTITNLRVRVTAPKKILVKNAMAYENKSAAEARKTIDKYMKIRHDYVYKFFSKNINKAHYYDVVVNTAKISVDEAADLVVFAFRQKIKKLRKLS